MSHTRILIAAATLAATAGCATTGSTFRSGVGDRYLEHPPYYAGSRAVGAAERVSHLPIGYQRGAAQAPIFDPAASAGTPLAALLGEMNRYLDSLALTVPASGSAAVTGTPPDVAFGCRVDASGDCEPQDAAVVLGRKGTEMLLGVGRPSASWSTGAGEQLGRDGSGALLVLTLEVGQYRPRQTGLLGKKSVELGTGHTQELPWLTSLETPVMVLQLTGALIDRQGQAMRIGAEGLLARRTNIVMSGFGTQALITDDDVERVRTLRRDDLPGQPLAWQVAMRELVSRLVAR